MALGRRPNLQYFLAVQGIPNWRIGGLGLGRISPMLITKEIRFVGLGDSFLRMETARIIRTPIRPLFPAHFYHDVEVMARFLCRNGLDELDTDVMAANATSAALMLSDIPWGGPIGVHVNWNLVLRGYCKFL
ncbi:hypothetical protein MKW98_029474 [Papaver atlanticum]|uniref:Exoribonuclease phosphorolytic domain-containing protein n=1 Tax=Papaver atlanticum TaxID=357466 RepID=A0AAD4SKE3_9MAGN|nr:hypothetical protein MKW98_029474 [Papaver atlanticum]